MNIQEFSKYNKIKSLTIHYTESDIAGLKKLDNEVAIVRAFSDLDMNNFKIYTDIERNYSLDLYLIRLSDCTKQYVEEALKNYDQADWCTSEMEDDIWSLISLVTMITLAFAMAPKLYDSFGLVICIPLTIILSFLGSAILMCLFTIIWIMIKRRTFKII